MTYFGGYLREARGSKSLSQAAAIIGCTKAHLWELETGRADNPGIKLLHGISRAYCIPLDCLAVAWETNLSASPAGPESLGVSQDEPVIQSSGTAQEPKSESRNPTEGEF